MFAYLFVFFLSALLIYCSEQISPFSFGTVQSPRVQSYILLSNKRSDAYKKLSFNSVISCFLTVIALLLPIVLAAIRSPEIGTDVKFYAIPHFDNALRCKNYADFVRVFDVSLSSEPLYSHTLFAITRITDNYHIALGLYETITIVFVHLGFKRLKKQMNVPIWLGMLIYYLMYFNISLNIIRQSMAVSIVFYATTFLFENKKIFFIYVFIAFLFHTTGIFGIVFFPMYLMLKKPKKGVKYSDIKKVIVFLCFVLITIVLLDHIVNFLVNIGLVRKNLLNYLSDGSYSSHYVSVVSICIYLILFLAYALHLQFIKNRNLEMNFFFIVSILMQIFSFGSLISVYISRICFYFIPFQAFALSSVQTCYKKNSRVIWNILIISYVLITWLVFFVIKNNNSTYPYRVDMELF